MPSTSASEPNVKVKDIQLNFATRLHPEFTLRDRFVNFLKSPVNSLLQSHDIFTALNDISFEASVGDRIAIIGKNGAGKTTLCRCLTGIYKPQRGKIELTGHVRSIIDPSTIIYPDLTGRENAKIMMQLLYPHKNGLASQALEEALEFSGLGDHLDKSFRRYSNGMQTRLCLSLATCFPSDIFILDEVFEGADAEFQERVSERILKLISQSGIVFFVSHSESQIRRVCNKGLLLHEGKIIDFGQLDVVLNKYSQLSTNQP